MSIISFVLVVGYYLLVPILYVGFLRAIDNTKLNRDNPKAIKRRAIGVSIATGLSVILAWLIFYGDKTAMDALIAFGVRFSVRSAFVAVVVPLLLTAILFFGSFCVMYKDGTLQQLSACQYWRECLVDVVWIRNVLIAPITEEIAFRSCCASVLLLEFGWPTVTLLAPLPFALSHYHHILDKRKQGASLQAALFATTFQAFYTYLFGVYATFIFIRTGHVLSAIVCHMLCNLLGFPPLEEVAAEPCVVRRWLLVFAFLFGLLVWLVLLSPLTAPKLYI